MVEERRIALDNDGSIRAMENPISAVFDLSESVNEQVPRIKRMIQLSGVFVVVWLGVNFILLLTVLASADLCLFMLLAAFLVLGSFGLYLMWNINSFFEYFSRRHLAIKLIRDSDTLVHVPEESDLVKAYIAHLRRTNRELDQVLSKNPRLLHVPALLNGASDITYNFDGYIFRSSSLFWRLLGIGDPGYSFFVKKYDRTPTLDEVQAIERAVQDVTSRTKVRPSRVVMLVTKEGGAHLHEDVYEHVTTRKPVFRIGRRKFVTNLQIVSVDEDDTFDFVPVIAEMPERLP